jgi:hypothetical protein
MSIPASSGRDSSQDPLPSAPKGDLTVRFLRHAWKACPDTNLSRGSREAVNKKENSERMQRLARKVPCQDMASAISKAAQRWRL